MCFWSVRKGTTQMATHIYTLICGVHALTQSHFGGTFGSDQQNIRQMVLMLWLFSVYLNYGEEKCSNQLKHIWIVLG